MNLYLYKGPVLEFDRIVDDCWKGETYAVSEVKARANLAFQYKRDTGRVPRSKITLPGKLILKGDDRT